MPSPKDPTLKRCSRCRKLKRRDGPAPEFYRPDHTMCSVCHRLNYTRRYQDDPEFRAKEKARQQAYRASHKEEIAAQRKAYRPRANEHRRELRQTPMGKLKHNRDQARAELKQAKTEAQKLRISQRLLAYEREIERLAQAKAKENEENAA